MPWNPSDRVPFKIGAFRKLLLELMDDPDIHVALHKKDDLNFEKLSHHHTLNPGFVRPTPGPPGPTPVGPEPVSVDATKCTTLIGQSVLVTNFETSIMQYSLDAGVTWINFSANISGAFSNPSGIPVYVAVYWTQILSSTSGTILVRLNTPAGYVLSEGLVYDITSAGVGGSASGTSWLVQLGGGSRTNTAAGAVWYAVFGWNLGDTFGTYVVPKLADTVRLDSSNPYTLTYGPSNYVDGFLIAFQPSTCVPDGGG